MIPTYIPDELAQAIETTLGPISDYAVYVLDGQTAEVNPDDGNNWHDALVIAEHGFSIRHLAHRIIKFTRDPQGQIEYYFPERPDIPAVQVGSDQAAVPPKRNKPPVIGLTGAAGAGKNAVGEILERPYGYTALALADSVRQAAWEIDPIITARTDMDPLTLRDLVNELGWDTAKRKYPEVRRILQRVGTEAGWQMHGENLWTDLLSHKIKAAFDSAEADREDPTRSCTGIVVTDVRFPHEIELIKALGGQIWHVDRPGLSMSAGTATHASETSLAGHSWDHEIDNNGTLEDLKQEISKKMNTYSEWFDWLAGSDATAL